jgi:outer membrane protein OmpA-like peptidoglycan-associated protein
MRLTTSVLIKKWLYLTTPLLLLLAGCGPSQDETMAKDRLEQARAVYNQAQANPAVTGTAQVSLMEAKKDLDAAENASDYQVMEHRAYLAQKKSQTALSLAEGKIADRDLEHLQKESNDAILKVKEQQMAAKGRELQSAQTAAEMAKSEAESAKSEAVTAKSQAEVARTQAEMAKSDAERAKSEALMAKTESEKTRAENEQLVRELSELKGKKTDRGIVLTIGDLLFDTGKSTLSAQANSSIGKLAQFLLNHPARNLSIEGHTDSVGSEAYNDTLSQKRAEAVKNALVAKGVGTERIVTKGLGKRFPIASNETAQGRQLNRRVEVVVLNEAAVGGATGGAIGGAPTEAPAESE